MLEGNSSYIADHFLLMPSYHTRENYLIIIPSFFFKLIHKFITRCSIGARSQSAIPGTLQYTAESTQRNLMRNVKQNPDHSQLIQTQEK